MQRRYFLLGLLAGLAIAPASGRENWRMLRNRLAWGLDVLLRIGLR